MPKAETKVDVNTNLLVALLLKVGGMSLSDGEIERAKTHVLVVNRKEDHNSPAETLLGAEPSP